MLRDKVSNLSTYLPCCFDVMSINCSIQVEIQHDAGTTTLEVDEDQTILEAALDSGLELSHDCKMGVCMTCPAKLVRLHVNVPARNWQILLL